MSRQRYPVRSYLDFNPAPPVLTLRPLGWNGMTVDLDHLDPFEQPASCYGEHYIGINLGDEIEIRHAVDGHSFTGTVPRGHLVLSPAGRPVEWSLYNKPAVVLGLMLRPEFVREVALKDRDVDPDRVELIAGSALNDPCITHVGALLHRELQSGGLNGPLFTESLAHALAVASRR
jgi:AraC family transcriptional regulator